MINFAPYLFFWSEMSSDTNIDELKKISHQQDENTSKSLKKLLNILQDFNLFLNFKKE